MRLALRTTLAALVVLPLASSGAQSLAGSAASSLTAEAERRATAVDDKVVTWRRDFHQHPELSNRETRTGSRHRVSSWESRQHSRGRRHGQASSGPELRGAGSWLLAPGS